MMTDEKLMRQCLDLARVASEKGDSLVGSLIVQDGRIVAQGIEAVKSRNGPNAHAEIEALRSACESLRTLDLSGSVLYTNVEPCWMCTYAIRQTRNLHTGNQDACPDTSAHDFSLRQLWITSS